jgi:hypothetical protein
MSGENAAKVMLIRQGLIDLADTLEQRGGSDWCEIAEKMRSVAARGRLQRVLEITDLVVGFFEKKCHKLTEAA